MVNQSAQRCIQIQAAALDYLEAIFKPYIRIIGHGYLTGDKSGCTRVGTLSHKALSPCDFDLIPKMKEPLRGIRFRTVPEILQAVDRSIRTINTTGATKSILRLPHRWQRAVNNAGDYIEGQ